MNIESKNPFDDNTYYHEIVNCKCGGYVNYEWRLSSNLTFRINATCEKCGKFIKFASFSTRVCPKCQSVFKKHELPTGEKYWKCISCNYYEK